jgi:O-antigen/teichoic acid export membrane protein
MQATSLRNSAYSAGRWTTASALFRAILQLGLTITLARLLTPVDFGLMALANVILLVANLAAELGLSSALIHFPRPDRPVLSTLYWLNMASACAFMLMFAAAAWPLAAMYTQPELLPVVLTLSLSFPLSALGQQFKVLAEKDLRFASLAWIEAAAASLGAASALGVAFLGGGVYALVTGLLTTTAVGSVLSLLYLSEGQQPRLHFRFADSLPFLRFGMYKLGDGLFNILRMQSDIFIGGLYAGTSALGIYSLPRDLSLKIANTVINPVVTRISLPIMAKVQQDPILLKAVYLQTLRMTASLNVPVFALLMMYAEQVVALLLGEQWKGADFYLRIFAAWGLVRSVGNPVGSLLYATGLVRRAFWWNVALLLVIPLLLLAGAHLHATQGLAWAMLGTQLLVLYPAFRFLVQPACGASFREYAAQLLPPFQAGICAIALGYLVSVALPLSYWLQFAAGASAALAGYLGASFIVNRPWFSVIYKLLRPNQLAAND